jgi:hypothetical protein
MGHGLLCAVLRYRSVVGRLLFLAPGARKNRGDDMVGIHKVLGMFFYVTTPFINNLVSIKWGHTSQKVRGGETSNLGSGGTFTREGLVPLFLR